MNHLNLLLILLGYPLLNPVLSLNDGLFASKDVCGATWSPFWPITSEPPPKKIFFVDEGMDREELGARLASWLESTKLVLMRS